MTHDEFIRVEGDIVTLKEYLESRLESIDTATILRAAALDKRMDAMNQIREQLATQKTEFLTRLEYDSKHQMLCDKIETVQKFVWMVSGALLLIEIALQFVK